MNTKQRIHRHLNIAVRQLQRVILVMEVNNSPLEVLSRTAEVRLHIRRASELLISNHIHNCIANLNNMKNINKTLLELLLAVKTASKYNIPVLS